MKKKLILELTEEELNLILTTISNLPYLQVFNLIHKIQQQAGPQLLENYQNGKEIHAECGEPKQT